MLTIFTVFFYNFVNSPNIYLFVSYETDLFQENIRRSCYELFFRTVKLFDINQLVPTQLNIILYGK